MGKEIVDLYLKSAIIKLELDSWRNLCAVLYHQYVIQDNVRHETLEAGMYVRATIRMTIIESVVSIPIWLYFIQRTCMSYTCLDQLNIIYGI